MFGKNPVMKQLEAATGFYLVKEIFPTIQGEGPLAGLPATFVRLGGCNLRCHFCDTDFSTETSIPMAREEVIDRCETLDNDLIVITGGEPLLQRIESLAWYLMERGFKVQVETAGTVELIDPFKGPYGKEDFTLVVSPKTANLHPTIVSQADAYKYIIKAGCSDPADGLPLLNTQDLNRKPVRLARPPEGFDVREIYLQPMDETHIGPDCTKANVDEAVRISMKHGYRLSLQLHKILQLP